MAPATRGRSAALNGAQPSAFAVSVRATTLRATSKSQPYSCEYCTLIFSAAFCAGSPIVASAASARPWPLEDAATVNAPIVVPGLPAMSVTSPELPAATTGSTPASTSTWSLALSGSSIAP